MKNALKGLWRMFLYFWYPAVMICLGAESVANGFHDRKWAFVIIGVLFTLIGLINFYEESEKLRKEEDKDTKSEPMRDLTDKEADIYDKWLLSESTDTGETLIATFKQEEPNE